MIITMDFLKKKAKRIYKIANSHGVTKLRVFGSVAIGTSKKSSDVDFLVRMKRGKDLLDLAGFKVDVEELLDCEVDVVSEGGLSPYVRDQILSEARPL